MVSRTCLLLAGTYDAFSALNWFKEHFIKCNDRAALVKTWLPAQYEGPKTWLDQLVYDRALVLVRRDHTIVQVIILRVTILQSRTAARKELLDQATSPDECEKLYEESLWCLYALQDDLLQTGNPFMEEDRATIATCMSFHALLICLSDVVCRDQADEIAPSAVSRTYGNERSGSCQRRSCRPEPC